jgi:hypothetical protein
VYKEHEGKNDRNGINFCWMCSRLLASMNVIEFHTIEAYSNWDLTKVKYKT